MSDKLAFSFNVRAHEKVAAIYKKNHTEIYNSVEQSRLRLILKQTLSLLSREASDVTALDFGAGDGNLTDHLIALGCKVVAADISLKFLSRIQGKHQSEPVQIALITNENQIPLPDKSVDFIGVYSVLHHIQDYLGIFDEFERVLNPGGIIYLDHEIASSFWNLRGEDKIAYDKFMALRKKPIRRFFKLTNYIDWFIRRFINPKYQREGDIHVWADDHIHWDLIVEKTSGWSEVVDYKEYLLFRGGFDANVYNRAKESLVDTAFLILRKKF